MNYPDSFPFGTYFERCHYRLTFMLYRITASGTYRDGRLLDEYPCLKEFGWKLIEHGENPFMRYTAFIEINTLEDLQKLQAAVEDPLIFTEDEIEIYDDYRE